MPITVIKSADMDYVDVGDLIIYTIVINNTENVGITNASFTDKLPTQLFYTQNSFYENGVSRANVDVTAGAVTLGNIPANRTTTVQFQVVVKDFYPYQNINNQCSIKYTAGTIVNTTLSNILVTTLTKAYLNISKSGDGSAPLNGVINYNIILTNVGNTIAQNVRARDILDSKVKFLYNSVYVNGVFNDATSPNSILVGNIDVNKTATVTFKAITTVPVGTSIQNVSDCFYTYTVNPSDVNGSYGTFYSNFFYTNIVNYGLKLNKIAIPNSIAAGQIGSYQIGISNIGAYSLFNVIAQDTLPNNISFVNNSVTLDGSSIVGDIQAGINIGTLNVGQTRTIQFKFNALNSNVGMSVANVAKSMYTYNVNRIGETYSNEAELFINTSGTNVQFTKIATPTIANMGDQITYTIVAKNNGLNSISNVLFKDTLPNLVVFNNNSVTIDGNSSSGNISTGINLNNLAPQQATTIIFTGSVQNVLSATIASNIGQLSFTDALSLPNLIYTNTADVSLNQTIYSINGNKITTPTIANTGQSISYTIIVQNNGNTQSNNIIVQDTLPSPIGFLKNSVSVNGSNIPSADITTGVVIGYLKPNQTATVTFSGIVNYVQADTLVSNVGSIYYSDLANNQFTTNTNSSNLQLNKTVYSITANQIVTPTIANTGDTITYTVVVSNTGQTVVNNAIFVETLPTQINYNQNSVMVNGVLVQNGNINTGVNIGTLNPGAVATITFTAKPGYVQTTTIVSSAGSISYIDANNTNQTVNTNKTSINLNATPYNIVLNKSVTPNPSNANGSVNYSIGISNLGIQSVNNVIFVDTVPNIIDVQNNSIKVNGNLVAGANLNTGINVGTIASMETITVTFNGIVKYVQNNTIANNISSIYFNNNGTTINVNSNTSSLNITGQPANINLGVIEQTNTTIATNGSDVIYTTTIKNNGSIDVNNLIYTSNLGTGQVFKAGSVIVNGVTTPLANVQNGVNLGTLPAGQSVVVQYVTTINAPLNDTISNNSYGLKYNYGIENLVGTQSGNGTSIVIKGTAGPSNTINIVKISDKTYAGLGDKINYTITLKNVGLVDLKNLIFSDTISVGTTYIDGSLTVDGHSIVGNIETGINIGDLGINSLRTINFSVLVN